MRSGHRTIIFCSALLFCGRPAARAQSAAAAAPEVPVSSAAQAQGDQGRLLLNISKNSSYSRVGLDYSLRWDFSDLTSFRPRLRTLTTGLQAISSWDITENTRVNYYGFRTNPWRVIIGTDRQSGAAAGGAAGTGGGGIVARPAPRKRLRVSLSPLVDDVMRNFDENLRDFLLKSSLRSVSPGWEKTGDAGRREFMRDVLSLGFWDTNLPLVREGRESLEYISTRPVASKLR